MCKTRGRTQVLSLSYEKHCKIVRLRRGAKTGGNLTSSRPFLYQQCPLFDRGKFMGRDGTSQKSTLLRRFYANFDKLHLILCNGTGRGFLFAVLGASLQFAQYSRHSFFWKYRKTLFFKQILQTYLPRVLSTSDRWWSVSARFQPESGVQFWDILKKPCFFYFNLKKNENLENFGFDLIFSS